MGFLTDFRNRNNSVLKIQKARIGVYRFSSGNGGENR